MIGPYSRVLRYPGALRFSITGLFARLQMSMAGMGLTLMVVDERMSYTLAAQIVACYALANALIGPQLSRLVDQYGQQRIVPLQLAIHVPATLALIFCITLSGLVPLLFVLAVLAGAAQPSVGSLVRARWSKIYTGTTDLRAAYSFESLLDEVVFISGPPLATVLALQISPSAALLVATLVLTVGCVALVMQRSTQPIPSGLKVKAGRNSALLLPGVWQVTIIFIFVGAIFGAFEITTIGFAAEQGVPGWTGLLLAVYAFGSLVGGFIFGALRLKLSLPVQFRGMLVVLAVVSLPLALISSPWLLGLLGLIAGFAVAPVLIAGAALVEQIVPPQRLTEAITWSTGGLAVGVSAGLLVSGMIVDRSAASNGYLVMSASALIAAMLALLLFKGINTAYQNGPQPANAELATQPTG